MLEAKHYSLFLCSTPLQVKIALTVIDYLNISLFDVVYFTRKDGLIDRSYFNEIAESSAYSQYICTKSKKKGLNILQDILSLRLVKNELKLNKYDRIFLASFDNILFRYIIRENKDSSIYGFDDGTANINSCSSYFNPDKRHKTLILNSLLRLASAQEVIDRITEHYSIYSGFDFFIDKQKVTYLPLFDFEDKLKNNKYTRTISFFIGQPFEEYLTTYEISKLKKWLACSNIDYYIPHPREKKPLVNNITILDKKGLIAEECIYLNSKGFNPIIYSGFSTVLFNINSKYLSKKYLSISHSPEEIKRCDLIKLTDSEILEI